MRVLNTLKFAGKRFVNLIKSKFYVHSFFKHCTCLLLVFSLFLSSLTLYSFASETEYITKAFDNPLSCFPNAFYHVFERNNVKFNSFYSVEHNYIDDNSARFLGQFQTQQAFDNWSLSDGAYKIFLRGNSPITRLQSGDKIRLRSTILLNWLVNPPSALNDELWHEREYGFLPTYCRLYFTGINSITGEAQTLNLAECAEFNTGYLMTPHDFVLEDDSALNIWKDELESYRLQYQGQLPSVRLPYLQSVKPYQTSVHLDITITIPNDMRFDSQPFNICFTCDDIDGGGKYERVNFIEYEFHNFLYEITTSASNLEIYELEKINQQLKDQWNQYGDPIIPLYPNKDTLNNFNSAEDSALNNFNNASSNFLGMFDYSNDGSLAGIFNSVKMFGLVVNSFYNELPFVHGFLMIAIPLGCFGFAISLGAVIYNNSHKDIEGRKRNNYRKR